MKSIVWLSAVLFMVSTATAEERAIAKTVKVTGISEVRVAPDRAIIEVGVEKQSPNASEAKRAEDAVARRILSSLRANGIDEKDVQTTWLSLQPRSYYRKQVRISYFVATQTLLITVRDLAKLDPILQSLVQSGGNQIDGIAYETSDLRKYRDQARELAVKAAREKAIALAHAVGQEIGKAQSIEEVPEAIFDNGIMANEKYEMGETRAKRLGPSLAPGQKSISASVVVSFDLQ